MWTCIKMKSSGEVGKEVVYASAPTLPGLRTYHTARLGRFGPRQCYVRGG